MPELCRTLLSTFLSLTGIPSFFLIRDAESCHSVAAVFVYAFINY
jgi:hypothetical protein